MKKTVCHISYNHQPFDDRIYWKELLTLQEAGYETVHLCVGDKEQDIITSEGIRIVQVKRRASAANIWIMRLKHLLFGSNETIQAIFEKAKELQAAVYHYHDLQINALTRKLKKLPHRPKVIYDVHEIYWLLVKNEKQTNFFKTSYQALFSQAIKLWELRQAAWCDLIILSDKFGYEHFEKHMPGALKTIIYNYSFFEPEAPNHHEKIYDFVYAGGISQTRGIEEIIQACGTLRTEFPELKCLLIGTAEKHEYIQKLEGMIDSLDVGKNVLLHAAVPFAEIKDYYRQSRIGFGLYYPTKKYSNAIAIKLFEYMAFGLPVIFANHGPSAEIIEKENCGLLVDVYNNESIVEAMRRLLTDKNRYKALSENGLRAVKEYSWNNEKNKLLTVYNILLGSMDPKFPLNIRTTDT